MWSEHGLTQHSANVGATFQNFLPDLVWMRKGILSLAWEMEGSQSFVSSTSQMHVISWSLIVDSGNYRVHWVQSWWVSLKTTTLSCSDKFLWNQPVVELSEPFWSERRCGDRCRWWPTPVLRSHGSLGLMLPWAWRFPWETVSMGHQRWGFQPHKHLLLRSSSEFTLGRGQEATEWESVRGKSKHADRLRMFIH